MSVSLGKVLGCRPPPSSQGLPRTRGHESIRPGASRQVHVCRKNESIQKLAVSEPWGFRLWWTNIFPKEGQGDLPNPLGEQKVRASGGRAQRKVVMGTPHPNPGSRRLEGLPSRPEKQRPGSNILDARTAPENAEVKTPDQTLCSRHLLSARWGLAHAPPGTVGTTATALSRAACARGTEHRAPTPGCLPRLLFLRPQLLAKGAEELRTDGQTEGGNRQADDTAGPRSACCCVTTSRWATRICIVRLLGLYSLLLISRPT